MPRRGEYRVLTGQRFGRLTVLAFATLRHHKAHWVCRCDCGVEKVVAGHHLTALKTISCGCHRRAMIAAALTRHGMARARGRRAEYRAWAHAVARCHNPNDPKYPIYGARGIRVCAEWRADFAAFIAHIGPKPDPALTLDRINNDGHYEPGNVRWATRSEQQRNKRPRRRAA